jgi:hypothetical protein
MRGAFSFSGDLHESQIQEAREDAHEGQDADEEGQVLNRGRKKAGKGRLAR